MDSSEFENSKSNLVNMKETIPKAMPLAITKNFFNFQDIQDDESSSPTKLIDNQEIKNDSSTTRKKKVSHKNIKLKPIGNATPQVIQLKKFKNNQRPQQNPEKRQQKIQKKQVIKEKEHEVIDRKKRLNFQIQSSDQEVQSKPIQQNTKVQSQRPEEYQMQQIQNIRYRQQQQTIVSHNIQNQQNNHQQNQQNQHEQQNVTLQARPLKLRNPVIFIMKRDKQWLNKIWPQFNLHYQSNNQFYISAKLTGNNASTTFMMCSSKSNFAQNGDSYFGKVKANFIGNLINVYGPGYNPTDHKTKRLPLRQILATVEYQTNFFGSTRPRNFKVYVLKKDLVGPQAGQDQIPLSQLYQRQQNKDKIILMQNRKPQWNENMKGFMLNFGGRVKKASIKNFILQDVQNPDTVRLIFGKLDDDQFRLDVGQPITPLVGFGIALSTFGGKIGCQ